MKKIRVYANIEWELSDDFDVEVPDNFDPEDRKQMVRVKDAIEELANQRWASLSKISATDIFDIKDVES
jgi:hypothetical protein